MNNPHTTISGIVAAISLLIAFLANLAKESADLAAVVPETWRPYVVGGAAIIGAVALAWNGVMSKDKTPLPLILALLLPAFCLSGCVTDATTGKSRLKTPDEIAADVAAFQANPKVQAVERAAAAAVGEALLSAAQTEMNGGQFNSTWAMAAGFNSIAAAVRTLPASQAQTLIVSTAQNFSADPSTKPLAQKLAAAYVAANPKTPAEKTATVVALATGTQQGAQTAAEALP